MKEKWLPLVGWEGCYEISNNGRVRSIERYSPINSLRPDIIIKRGGGIRKQYVGRGGYYRVGLSGNGKRGCCVIHRAVLEAFVGPCPDGMMCCHYDGDKFNNNLDNLRWDTCKNNCKDTKRHGRRQTGQDHHSATLTNKQASRIKEYLAVGISPKDIAEQFNINRHTVYNIKEGVCY